MIDRARRTTGVTLIELLIVLVILAALTGIAVRSLEPVADQARYEATQTTLQNVDEAILQQTRAADGTLGYSGFVADMGRLPFLFDVDPDPSVVNLQPVELWTDDIDFDGGSDLIPFQLRTYVDPFTGQGLGSVIASGWRGPYIQPPTSEQEIRDGYGRPLRFEVNAATKQLASFRSLGSDGLEGSRGGTYDVDSLSPSVAYDPARYRGTLDIAVTQGGGVPEETAGNAFEADSNSRLFVRVYGASQGISSVPNVPAQPASSPVILANEQLPEINGSFDVLVPSDLSGLPIGTYLVQAVVTERMSGDFGTADGGEQVVENRVSRVHRVTIQPGVTSVVLEIPPPPPEEQP